jgi:hypothetical protein
MDTALFDLTVRMASSAHERCLRLVVQFAAERSFGMLVRGKIGMTLRTGKSTMDGGLELFSVDIGLDEFIVFECHHQAVPDMTG